MIFEVPSKSSFLVAIAVCKTCFTHLPLAKDPGYALMTQ
jgi:hypothetical protein